MVDFPLLLASGLPVPLCCGLSKPPSMQLQKIMGEADELPFAFYVVETTEQELPKPSHALDLAKDGLDGLLSLPVCFLPLFRLQESFHFLLDGEMVRDSPTGRHGSCIGMPCVSGRDEGLYAFPLRMGEIFFTVVTRIGAQLLRYGMAVFFYLGKHRLKLVFVIRLDAATMTGEEASTAAWTL